MAQGVNDAAATRTESRTERHAAPALDAKEATLQDATALGQWVLGLASFVALCYYGRMLWLTFVPKNGYVTQPQIKEFQADVRGKLDKISEDVQKLVVSVAVLEERDRK